MKQVIIRENDYRDSVMLMVIAKEIRKAKGVEQVIIVMGTETNKGLLKELGFLTMEVEKAKAHDMLIAIQGENQRAVDEALRMMGEVMLQKTSKKKRETSYSTLEAALNSSPRSSLVFISVPGEYAADEAKKALMSGVNAFIFSDNVPVEEERELKRLAQSKNLLVMGPGCGASVINGISLGLMSRVRSGPVGIVAASGSGMQEVAILVDRMGLGISQAIGTGGRDLSDDVGGITMLQGIEFLENDAATKVIVLVSKPPGTRTVGKITQRVSMCSKPVIVCFLGLNWDAMKESKAILVGTLEEAALKAVSFATGRKVPGNEMIGNNELLSLREKEKGRFAPSQKYLRGLFCGGTLCEEALFVLKEYCQNLYSNVDLPYCLKLRNANESQGHTLLDMGAEEFTRGKPHPVINPEILAPRLRKEGSDPEVAVILMDIILGYGAHDDPVGVLQETIGKLGYEAERNGRHLKIVASVCGTEKDPQDLISQENRLRDTGVIVMPSNRTASILAGLLISP